MNRDEIMTMVPGRELDELIQVRFFEQKFACHVDGCINDTCSIDGEPYDCAIATSMYEDGLSKEDCTEWRIVESPKYSTDISAAWEIFTHFGWQGGVSFSSGDWYCEIMYGFDKDGCGAYAKAEGETAPLAICKAALLAMEGSE